MKKITITFLFIFILGSIFSQTIVSTSPMNKIGILEEFTGIHCGFCPQGHTIANTIKNNNPDTFYIINIHTGGYAVPGNGEPDFRTSFGSSIGQQSGLTGYPSGTVNRHVFSGTATALGRGAWESSFNTLKVQSSYLNVGVEAEINIATREITVHTEVYYTGNSPVNTNLLNIALLQNHTTGPQSGGNAGNNYDHNHRLVHMLTGQWGETINTTASGTFVDRTITYTVPIEYRGVLVDMYQLEVVSYVAETHQEIISGKGAEVTTTGVLLQNDANIYNVEISKGNCDLTISPEFYIYNGGQNEITALNIVYNINGGAAQVYNWTGSLNSLKATNISIPQTNLNLENSNTIDVTIINSDGDMANNTFVKNFTRDEFLPETTEDVHVFIATDNWGYELTWNIKNSIGMIVASGGGDGTNGSAGSYANNSTVTETYNFPEGCYVLRVNDDYEDGGNAVAIRTTDDQNITYIAGGYGAGDDVSFKTSSTAAVANHSFTKVSIYPNPSSGVVTFTQAKDLKVSVYDIFGKEIFNSELLSNNEELDLSNFSAGVYLVNITDGNKKETRKLILK